MRISNRMLLSSLTTTLFIIAANFTFTDTTPTPTPAHAQDVIPSIATESQAQPDFNPDAVWRMVVLPDIQSYNDHSEYAPILEEMCGWIVDNSEELNIALVLQEGDIVFQNAVPFGVFSSGDQSGTQQWGNAKRALSKLDGVVPYILVPGNHDYGVYDADNRNTRFTKYFKVTDNPLNDPAEGGILAELCPNAFGVPTQESAAYDFTAPDGRKLLFLALEWGPRRSVIDWAHEVAQRTAYADHTKVLLTHAYMYYDDTRFDWQSKGKGQGANPHQYGGTNSDTSDGQELWDGLVGVVPGFELVFCGHVGGDMVAYLESEGATGQSVHQMLFNAQFLPKGGEGWLRVLEFMPDGTTVNVRTYSPYFELDGDGSTSAWRSGADDDFTIQLSPNS